MMEIKELVWLAKGFEIDTESLKGDFPNNREVFFEGTKLELAMQGHFEVREYWVNKYNENIFVEEYECLEDALDHCDGEQEEACITERMSEIEVEEGVIDESDAT